TVDMMDGQRVPVQPSTFTTDPSPVMRSVMKEGARLINRDLAASGTASLLVASFPDACTLDARRSNGLESSAVPPADLVADVPFVLFGDSRRRSESMMYVPIRFAGSVLGLISIQSYTPQGYVAEDLNLLQALADHCGDALHLIKAGEALIVAESKSLGIVE